ncbi:MAG: cytochrome c4 [Methylohalobius sp.]|nr:cytochrome c4 [Methylohalobius sp.]
MKTILTAVGVLGLMWSASLFAAQLGTEKTALCVGCHGEAGKGAAPLFPKLAGQNVKYLSAQLRLFKNQARSVPAMNAIAAPLSEEDIRAIAAYFAGQRPLAEVEKAPPEGERIYRVGIAAKNVPACSACHGPQGQGNAPAGFPLVKGQYAAYTVKALSDYASGVRGENTPMRAIAARLSEEEMKQVAAYMAALK